MALQISDAGINVTITRETRAPTGTAFGTLLFLDLVSDVSTRQKKYTSMSSVAVDYSADSQVYKAATAYYGQNPAPTNFSVGNVLIGTPATPPTAASATLTLTGTASSTDSADISIDTENYSATNIVSGTTTGADIASELAGLITANVSSAFTASAAGDVLTIVTKAVGTDSNSSILAVSQVPTDITTTITQFSGGADEVPGTSGENLQNALDAIFAEGDFFFVTASYYLNDVDADILDISAWCESNDRLFFNTSHDALLKSSTDTTNIAYQLKQLGYHNSLTVYSEHVGQYPNLSAAALLATVSYFGRNTTKTLKFKDLPGISVSDLSPNDQISIKGHNANCFYETASIRMFDDGRMASGAWADEVAGTEALADMIRINVFGLLSRTSTKVPLTEGGMSLLESEVKTALETFITNGFLSSGVDQNGDMIEAYEVSHIPIIDWPESQLAQRIAPDIDFVARLASAVHEVSVFGRLVLK